MPLSEDLILVLLSDMNSVFNSILLDYNSIQSPILVLIVVKLGLLVVEV